MYYADLTPFVDNPFYEDANGLNVGWLAKRHKFPQGDSPADFLDALHWVIADGSFTNGAAAGLHFCELCKDRTNVAERNGDEIIMGNTEIAIPFNRKVYIAPTLVFHYVDVHRYLPPQPFVKGVLKIWNAS